MSLTGPDFWLPEQGGVMPTAVGQECFRCEHRIARDPAWTWVGATGQVFLHLGCAADLQARIGYDLTLWQQKTGAPLPRDGRAIMRVFLGSWTTPGGNNVEAYIQGDTTAYRAALYWDDPPPFRNPADLDYYLSVILPVIVQLAQEYMPEYRQLATEAARQAFLADLRRRGVFQNP